MPRANLLVDGIDIGVESCVYLGQEVNMLSALQL